jgi:hypothetical protein
MESHPQAPDLLALVEADTLSDQHVWDIVARWHGLVPLLDLYLDPTISAHFRNAPPGTFTSDSDDDIPSTPPPPLSSPPSYPNDQTTPPPPIHPSPSTKSRFYLALISIWLPLEAARYAKIAHHPSQTSLLTTWQTGPRLLLDSPCFLDSIDRLEVYDFVHCFLTQHIQPCRPEAFNSWFRASDWPWLHPHWRHDPVGVYVSMVRWMMSPADIIELLLLTSLWAKQGESEWSVGKKRSYLRTRAIFTTLRADLHDADRTDWPDPYVMVDDMETSVLGHLQAVSGADIVYQWEEYRWIGWGRDIRGHPLFWEGGEEKVAGWIAWAIRNMY